MDNSLKSSSAIGRCGSRPRTLPASALTVSDSAYMSRAGTRRKHSHLAFSARHMQASSFRPLPGEDSE